MSISTKEFINMIAGGAPAGVIVPGDWYEGLGLLIDDDPILRKNAARLLHVFLLKVLKEPDETDTGEAWKLRDIYDCRVCAEHIAQVYSKGIMDAFFYEGVAKAGTDSKATGFCVFENNANMGADEAIDCIRRMYDLNLRHKSRELAE